MLRDFLAKIELVDLVGPQGVRISPDAARELLQGHQLPYELLRERQDDIAEFLRSDVSAPDVLALARRKATLETFERMLASPDLTEPQWQAFFEAEPWILGVAGAPKFLHRVGSRLESVVQGWNDFGTTGKKADAVLRTAGALSAFTFIKIKRPDTPLLRHKQYRSGAWAISDEVAGGVAQVHATVDAAQQNIGRRLPVLSDDGYDTGEAIDFCRPRALLVVGSLGQMTNDGAVHHERYRSFEAFRRSLREPEVVTFDELLHRARAVLALAGDDEHEQQPRSP